MKNNPDKTAMGFFRDSPTPSWLSRTRTDVPTEPPHLSHRPSRLIRNMYEILENSKIHNLSISCQLDLFDKVFKSILLNNSEIRARLFKILDKVIHWIKLSTGQLLIQWTASQWIKLVVQKQRQWLARYPLDKILSSGQFP